MIEQKNFYTIYNQCLAGYLMLNGFILVAVLPHKDKSGRSVYRFYDTPLLRDAIDKWQIVRDDYYGGKQNAKNIV